MFSAGLRSTTLRAQCRQRWRLHVFSAATSWRPQCSAAAVVASATRATQALSSPWDDVRQKLGDLQMYSEQLANKDAKKDLEISDLKKQLADTNQLLQEKDKHFNVIVALARLAQDDSDAASVCGREAVWHLKKADALHANAHYPLELGSDTSKWGLFYCVLTVKSMAGFVSFQVRTRTWGDCVQAVSFTGALRLSSATTGEVLQSAAFKETSEDITLPIDIQDLPDSIHVILDVERLTPVSFSSPHAFFDGKQRMAK
eukprot:TRINITY_DN72546_c0_g1_i1.p1 TRINITY_DN72546_c0_g1~~TRINITY_DN72546_c0_g1_i1.p1  ORF type:complete len:258 (+),score=51.85 TRINITY_DN72546_c0_g1_i1:56-829(+)